jgi:hypothetical protein
MTNASITGELLLQDSEIQAASREAVGSEVLRLALGAIALVGLASGTVWNLITGAGRASSLTSALAIPLVLLSLPESPYLIRARRSGSVSVAAWPCRVHKTDDATNQGF